MGLFCLNLRLLHQNFRKTFVKETCDEIIKISAHRGFEPATYRYLTVVKTQFCVMQEACTATVALEKQMESFPLHNIECARNGQFQEKKLVLKLNRFSFFRCVRREITEHCVYVEEMNARSRPTFRLKVPILQLLVVIFRKIHF